ncbi:tetratricopeptide repeat protein [Roseobacteraceae bacterium NS-SX3]
MRVLVLTLPLALLPAPAARAASCPAPPDHSAPLERLIAQVQAAASEAEARAIASRMWDYWADAPDDAAQAMLDRGMTRRAAFDFLGALQDFDDLIAYCPDYAEGYNQRAFVHYLRRDFASALADLDRALELSPRHIGALSGRALSLYGLSRLEEARAALAQALALNPWLPERGLAAPGGPLAPSRPGEVEL